LARPCFRLIEIHFAAAFWRSLFDIIPILLIALWQNDYSYKCPQKSNQMALRCSLVVFFVFLVVHFTIHLILYCYKLMTNADPLGPYKGNGNIIDGANCKSINNTLHTPLHTDAKLFCCALFCAKNAFRDYLVYYFK